MALTKASGANGMPTSHAGLSYLVADDNESMCDILQTYLTTRGAVVDTVENGKSALKKYLEAQDKYDLIILDMKMPIMGGEEAARSMRDNPPPSGRVIPIIAMSGEENPQGELFSGFLRKPFELIELDRIIEEV